MKLVGIEIEIQTEIWLERLLREKKLQRKLLSLLELAKLDITVIEKLLCYSSYKNNSNLACTYVYFMLDAL